MGYSSEINFIGISRGMKDHTKVGSVQEKIKIRRSR
jgi:hypothetical protein